VRGIYSLSEGVPERESVDQVVVVLDAEVALWLSGWIAAHVESRFPYEAWPVKLVDVLRFAKRYGF